jgi:hypothetical protein
VGFAVLLLAGGVRAGSEADLLAQQDRQKQIQADTDQMVRRVGTMLRVLEYYQVEKAAEKKMLEEVAVTLAGLSKDQMTQVIARLDAAARAGDPAKSEKEVGEAYIRHREILDSLKGLLAKYDAVKSLDQVAERLDKAARIQLELHLVTKQLIHNALERQKPTLSPVQRSVLIKQFPNILLEKKRQGDAQGDLRRDVEIVLKQAGELRPKLPPEQVERLKALEDLAARQRIMESFYRVIIKLGVPFNQFDTWKAGNQLQWEIAGQLRDLARILRNPADQLNALREVRDRLEQTIRAQESLKNETKEQAPETKKQTDPATANKTAIPPNKLTFPGTNPLPEAPTNPKTGLKLTAKEQALKAEETAQKNAELSTQQARLQFETQETQNLARPLAKETAEKVQTAERAMENAKTALEKKTPDKAVAPQEKAVAALEEAKKDVERMLAIAEKQKADPLAALKKAADTVEQLLKEQTATRNQTKDAAKDEHNLQLPVIANKQTGLAKRTEDLNEAPLPGKEKTQAALDKATAEMKKAAESLLDKKAAAAVPKQDNAIQALEQAKKTIGEQIAAIEKRREDIAKLEDASKKLGELAKQEGKVSDAAKDLAQKPSAPMAKELGEKQDQLTPQAKDVAKQLEKTAPNAAEKVADASKNMEAAKSEIDKNKLNPAAREADDAAQKLADAKDAVGKQLEQLRGKEIADQAAMQPNKVDPNAAAQRLAKALEQAQQAAKDAKDAEAKAKLDKPGPQRDLAKLQEQVAKKAAELKLPDAGKPAQAAADALTQSNLEKAVTQQEKALGKLQEAAAKEPGEEPQPMADPAKPGEAKVGEPMAADAKATAPQAGEPKSAEAKKGPTEPAQAKQGEAKDGQKAAEAKVNQTEPAQAKSAQAEPKPQAGAPKQGDPKTAQAKAGDAKTGQKAGQAKDNEPKAGAAKTHTTKAGQPKTGKAKSAQTAQPKAATPKAAQAKTGQTKGAQTKSAQAKPAQAKAIPPSAVAPKTADAKSGEAKTGQAKAGAPMSGEAKAAQAKASEGKAGAPMAGEAKAALAQAKDDQGKEGEPQAKSQTQAQVKGSGEAQTKQAQAQGEAKEAQAKGQGQMEPADAKNPAQLAEAQKGLMEATKALAKSQEATEAAMAALGQAKAQAPEGVQVQLQEAGQKLAEASKQLQEGTPGKAGEAQDQAAAKLESALKTLNEALAEMGQPNVKPGQTPTALARAAPKDGQQQAKEGEGKEAEGQKQPNAQAQAKGKKKGPGTEKNPTKGLGKREADGKLANAKSQLKDIQGDGSFLHLPPRQREMIRQALAGQLPPEYAAMIQQYYVNIARGRPATMPAPAASPPPSR